MSNNNINIQDTSISKEFYIELVNKMEDMFNKARTYGEVTLMGDLIELLNNKTELRKD